MLKRVHWEGPNPKPGEYLAGEREGLWLIRDVQPLPRPDRCGFRLILDLTRVAAPGTGQEGVIHPAQRYAAHDPSGPPRVRQTGREGHTAVMRMRWRDPDDTRPNASARPRAIVGWHTYCPLRRMAEQKGSQVTFVHIVAADFFRATHDVARHGYTAVRDMQAAHMQYGPRQGPNAAALAQTSAAAAVSRAMTRFAPAQRAMLDAIVLRNRSLQAWCRESAPGYPRDKPLARDIEMGRLLGILDILADHYQTEADTLMANEGVMAVERA